MGLIEGFALSIAIVAFITLALFGFVLRLLAATPYPTTQPQNDFFKITARHVD